jgi:hypothetical protein
MPTLKFTRRGESLSADSIAVWDFEVAVWFRRDWTKLCVSIKETTERLGTLDPSVLNGRRFACSERRLCILDGSPIRRLVSSAAACLGLAAVIEQDQTSYT